MAQQQTNFAPSVVRFEYNDPIQCHVVIESEDKRLAYMINSFISAAMTFYDKTKLKTW